MKASFDELKKDIQLTSERTVDRAVTEFRLSTERAVTESRLCTEKAVTESKLSAEKARSEFEKKFLISRLLIGFAFVLVLASAAPDSLVGKGAAFFLSLVAKGV